MFMFRSTNISDETEEVSQVTGRLRKGDCYSFIRDLQGNKFDPNKPIHEGKLIRSAIEYKRPSTIVELLQAGVDLNSNSNCLPQNFPINTLEDTVKLVEFISRTTDYLLICNALPSCFLHSNYLNFEYLGPLLMSYGLIITHIKMYSEALVKGGTEKNLCYLHEIAHLEKYQKIGSDIHAYRSVSIACLNNIEKLKKQDQEKLTNSSVNSEKIIQEWRDVFINAHLAKSLLLSLQAEQQALLLEKPSEEGNLYFKDYQFRIDQCSGWLKAANPCLDEAEQFNLLNHAIAKQQKLMEKAMDEKDKQYYQSLVDYLQNHRAQLNSPSAMEEDTASDSVPSESTETSPILSPDSNRALLFHSAQEQGGLYQRCIAHQEKLGKSDLSISANFSS